MKRRKKSSGGHFDRTAWVGATALVLTGLATGDANAEWPLLGTSMRGGSFADSFCEGRDGNSPKPDSEVVPPDPRTRLTKDSPYVQNPDQAVYFNAPFEDCHVGFPVEEQPLGYKTCGEYRERLAKAEEFLVSQMLSSEKSAAEHDSAWKDWGLSERPANYEALLAIETQGTVADYHNPYPLEGEDPNAPGVNGGSGQLPANMRQLKDAHGKWTGRVATQLSSCAGCHMSQVGDYGEPGASGSWGSGANANGALGGQRGQSDAHTAFELLYFTAADWDSIALNPVPGKYLGNKATNRSDTPAWWNVGHRTRKFFDGGGSIMGTRVDLSGHAVARIFTGDAREWIEKYDQDMQAFVESVRSPAWPEVIAPIDTALAEDGARVFHTKNLFAHPGNADRAKPDGGNGSCASCHGAYSPRYVNDPTYLPSPDFEGIAAHIVRPEVIGTDTARLDTLNIEFTDVADSSWWCYPDSKPNYVSPDDKTLAQEWADDNKALIPFTDYRLPSEAHLEGLGETTGLRVSGVCAWGPPAVPYVGYQAPPLYGIWASAPYFHNGSVPTVEAVLDPSRRLTIWQRKQVTTPTGKKAFDNSLATGYDFESMGWKVDEIPCEAFGNDPLYGCNPIAEEDPPITRDAINRFESNSMGGVATVVASGENPFMALSQVPTQETTADIDTRLIHDTRVHSNSNTGHEFTDVLTDAERKAIIEYLKTL